MRRIVSPFFLLAAMLPAACGRSSAPAAGGTVVLAFGKEPMVPVPVIGTGTTENADLADQLFLPLATPGADYRTVGDSAMQPVLARSWTRLDDRTITFSLDPRARWQDGQPVRAADVLYTWGLLTNPALNPAYPTLEPIDSVTAVDSLTVRVHYRRPFGEQVYLFTNDFQPLPAHLLSSIPPDSIASSPFAQHPIGNGPFRWVRREPGQFVELQADSSFFLGRPGISRLIIRVAADPAARLNLLLSGETDAMDNIPAPQLERVRADSAVRVLNIGNNFVVYALFNFREPGAPNRPHPILSDLRVREALTLALDRETMAHRAFGDSARVPNAVQSRLWGWITGGTFAPVAPDTAKARALLVDAGWSDRNGDGVLDRNGVPLRLDVIYPGTSATRDAIAIQAAAMWKAMGIDTRLDRLEGPVWYQRHQEGKFDLDLVSVNQSLSPSSLAQSWSCSAAEQKGSTNVAHWCDPVFDSLRHVAEAGTMGVSAWRAVLDRMAVQHPAIFLAAPTNMVAVHRRFERVEVRPVHQWAGLWRWQVRPGAELPRDR